MGVRRMLKGADWSAKRKALEDAAQAFGEAEVASQKEDALRFRELWDREQRRVAMIRKVCGVPDQHVDAVYAVIVEKLRELGHNQ